MAFGGRALLGTLLGLLLPVMSATMLARRRATPQASRLPLIPYPAVVELPPDIGAKPFLLQPGLDLSLGEGIPEDCLAVTMLRSHLGKIGVVRRPASRSGGIRLSLVNASEAYFSSSPEAYSLHIDASEVTLKAPALTGLFYGAQTLRQLASDARRLRGANVTLPAVTIRDAPRFAWRGLHLDVSRHFFTAGQVKKLLDTMAAFKLNKFHWHLTDDQGWRLPVDGYPRLTEIGSEGFGGRQAYTEAEIKDVVAYAGARHIEVLPEVDVPGHVAAAIAAYPELGNDDVPGWRPPSAPMREWGVSDKTLAPKASTWHFLEKVFGTVARLFPGKFVHMGGDEAKSSEWELSANALWEGKKVQTQFNERVGRILQEKGRVAVGWDETQHIGGLPQDSIIIAWRSEGEAVLAARSGRSVVNAFSEHLYFDRYQGPPWREPKAICCSLPLEKVYSYDPMPADLTASEQSNVLGAQAQLWSEYLPTWKQVEYMAFPRALALAERTWTPGENIQGFADFERRVETRVQDLEEMGVNYRRLTA